jgi:stage II sporulation protein AA (anti-sigma F factor antagonist)
LEKIFRPNPSFFDGILQNIPSFSLYNQCKRMEEKTMQLTFRVDGRQLTFFLSGELDEHAASTLRRLADDTVDEYSFVDFVVFDLSNVGFMDSTGIGFLIGRYKKCKRYSIPVYIKNPNPSADKILSISGVYTLIPKI